MFKHNSEPSSSVPRLADGTHLQRKSMVELIRRNGVTDERVCEAMLTVPREAFVPPELQAKAYDDTALSIGYQQTISQPYIVALMASSLELKATDRVLEVGTGSGYAAAILSRLAAQVYTVERIPELADAAKQRLCESGCNNVHVAVHDGTKGLADFGPFDAISVAAGTPRIPDALQQQITLGGSMVIPVGPTGAQQLIRLKRLPNGEFSTDVLCAVRFVPLIGQGHDLN